jgi:hypothetical protein
LKCWIHSGDSGDGGYEEIFFPTFTNKMEYMGTQYLGFFKVNKGNPLFGESIENMCYLFGIWGYGHIMSYHDIKVNTIMG